MPAAKKATNANLPASPGEFMASFNGTTLKAFSDAYQAQASGLAALNSELASFVRLRLQRDAELGHALVKCEDWREAAELQQDWAKQAATEYFEQAGKMVEVATECARDSLQPIYDGAEEAIEQAKDQAKDQAD